MANGEIHKGGTFVGQTFGNGCLFENCTFVASCRFGVGCVFVNCNFVWRRKQPFSYVGEGATVRGGSLDWVEFAGRASIDGAALLTVVLGAETRVDAGGFTKDSKLDLAYDHCKGEQISGSQRAEHDWCKYKCTPERAKILIEGQDGHVSGVSNGVEWSK